MGNLLSCNTDDSCDVVGQVSISNGDTFDDFSELINKNLSKDNISIGSPFTLLLISIVLNGYGDKKNALYNFYNVGNRYCNLNITIGEIDDLLKEKIIDENKCAIAELFLQLIHFRSKAEKIRCWKFSEEKLSKHPILDFIWEEMEDNLKDRFCEKEECDHIYSCYGNDFHSHCKECDATGNDTDDDFLPYCSKCVPNDFENHGDMDDYP